MPRKRDFSVKVESDDGKEATFEGEECVVKTKSIFARLGLTKKVKETIDCERSSVEIGRSRES
jgi:hypothetical protein